MQKALNGSEIIVETLKRRGVKVIFGLPGGAIMPFYDVLYDETDIRHVLVRHEQGAAHAADGYARASGLPGITISTSGPGATNLVTGLATAYADSSPVIAFSGQVPTKYIGKDAFQEADIYSLVIPITKHNFLVKDIHDLSRVVNMAFDIATTGRPGPVHIDLPKDIQTKRIKTKLDFKTLYSSKTSLVSLHKVKKAAKIILDAERPVILAGGGTIISGASEEIRILAEMLSAPVVTTLMGKGIISEFHPLSLGMLGMHGTKPANYAVMESDCLIGVGVRFDDRATSDEKTFAPKAKIIHIDIDQSEFDKNIKSTVPIAGDAKEVLKALIFYLQTSGIKKENSAWMERIKYLQKEFPLPEPTEGNPIKPTLIIKKLMNLIAADDIITTEVGQCEMWAALYYKPRKPRTMIMSGGQGTMGFGFPAAIGAKAAKPDNNVIDIAGDGSFLMVCQELATSVENNLPVTVAILDNRYLGMVRQWQELFFNKRYSYTYLGEKTDFVKLAEAFGAKGLKVTRSSEIEDALKEALKSDVTTVIDFEIDRKCNVFPMVSPGGQIDKMIG
ncbi:MAG: biosynthetic-type acetolactate synthase large subunit [Candidatus Odinarchaeia archaeon]